MNTPHEPAGTPPALSPRAVIEPLADHWQHERLWLELVADCTDHTWSLRLHDQAERRTRRHFNLDQVLRVLTSRSGRRS